MSEHKNNLGTYSVTLYDRDNKRIIGERLVSKNIIECVCYGKQMVKEGKAFSFTVHYCAFNSLIHTHINDKWGDCEQYVKNLREKGL